MFICKFHAKMPSFYQLLFINFILIFNIYLTCQAFISFLKTFLTLSLRYFYHPQIPCKNALLPTSNVFLKIVYFLAHGVHTYNLFNCLRPKLQWIHSMLSNIFHICLGDKWLYFEQFAYNQWGRSDVGIRPWWALRGQECSTPNSRVESLIQMIQEMHIVLEYAKHRMRGAQNKKICTRKWWLLCQLEKNCLREFEVVQKGVFESNT
jgi:hypothetical protein